MASGGISSKSWKPRVKNGSFSLGPGVGGGGLLVVVREVSLDGAIFELGIERCVQFQ